ncbi:MAG TPA: right-handed parallel beta-helix repeat-containing protein [Phycisphaerae bacterium]|nr:right-handed parallel beta-helix repeat-containing protein [Phycisphaerae bacterium]HRW53942.1 right-handed parallel beta-helix repeat-containing protein [Phycisphaerae bacterium]
MNGISGKNATRRSDGGAWRWSIALAIVGTLSVRPAMATVYLVDGSRLTDGPGGTSWATAFNNIDSAIGAAGSGDEIWVKGGSYSPGNTTSGYALNGGVSLYGGFAGTENPASFDPDTGTRDQLTILEGEIGSAGYSDNVETLVSLASGTTRLLDGFTIRNAKYVALATPTVMTPASATLRNLKFETNQGFSGVVSSAIVIIGPSGGVYLIEDCEFNYNGDTSVGGAGAIFAEYSTVTIEGCQFTGNATVGGGGAMWIADCDLTVNNCGFTENMSLESNGGAVLLSGLSASARFEDCTFYQNYAECDVCNTNLKGGAVYDLIGGCYTDCMFVGNYIFAHFGDDLFIDGDGGALAVEGGVAFTVNNSLFSQNESEFGAAIYMADTFGEVHRVIHGDIVNSTIADNHAAYELGGGGIYHVGDGDELVVENSILWNNTRPSGSPPADVHDLTAQLVNPIDSITEVYYSCVDDGTPGGSIPYNGTNIDSDPLFIVPGSNYRLASTSPCIDVGDNNRVIDSGCAHIISSVVVDLDHDDRIQDGDGDNTDIVDMGAYEYPEDETPPGPIYVDADSPALMPNGDSWALAYRNLQDGLTEAATRTSAVTIYVAQGTYLPDGGYIGDAGLTAGSGSRTATFGMLDDVTLEGGYAGYGETNPDDRDPDMYLTILSGDVGTVSDDTDNSHHILTASSVTNSAKIDGFTITKANAQGGSTDDGGGMLILSGSPAVDDCTFVGNKAGLTGGIGLGGAVYLNLGSPVFKQCKFFGNTAFGGSAVWAQDGSQIYFSCVFANNTSAGNSVWAVGALVQVLGSLNVTNCTIANNAAFFTSGGLFGTAPDVDVRNSILWGNTATYASSVEDEQIRVNPTAPDVDYCCIQGLSGSLGGTGNIDLDPRFVDPDGADNTAGTADDDVSLELWSPCIDAGNQLYVAFLSEDVDGDPRTVVETDIGAYETQYTAIYVDADSTAVSPDGSAWSLAFQDLQDGLSAASTALSGGAAGVKIRVAKGTYFPDGGYLGDTGSASGGGARGDSFELLDDVKIEGGYKGVDGLGTGTADDRDLSTFETILSGDINTSSVITDNSYTVVHATGVSETSVVEGVTITKGYAEEITSVNFGYGGGVLNQGAATPVFVNCRIVDNLAYHPSGYSNGAGAYTESGLLRLVNCVIADNEADGGAGVFIAAGGFSAVNCLFTGNNATGDNIYETGGAIGGSGTSTELVNCTFTANTATYSMGGGVALPLSYLFGTHSVTNCIFWGNTANGVSADADAQFFDGGGAVVTYSCIQDDDDSDASIPFNTGGVTSNIDDDPEFVNAGSGDYRLDDSVPSPCIDTGDNSVIPTDGTVDLDGNSRIVNTTVDMGAYEDQ